LANIAADPLASKGAHTLSINTASVVSTKMITKHHHTNIPIWKKHQARTRITNPKAIQHRKQAYQLHWQRTMFANVIHVVILTTWQMFAHKSPSINKMLRLNLKLTKAFWLYSNHRFPHKTSKHICASRMIDAWDEEGICSSCIQPCFFAHECNPSDSHVTQHVPHVRQTIANSNLLQYIQEAHKPHTNRLQASNPVSLKTGLCLQAEGQPGCE
jgi:hypothetical protein